MKELLTFINEEEGSKIIDAMKNAKFNIIEASMY